MIILLINVSIISFIIKFIIERRIAAKIAINILFIIKCFPNIQQKRAVST